MGAAKTENPFSVQFNIVLVTYREAQKKTAHILYISGTTLLSTADSTYSWATLLSPTDSTYTWDQWRTTVLSPVDSMHLYLGPLSYRRQTAHIPGTTLLSPEGSTYTCRPLSYRRKTAHIPRTTLVSLEDSKHICLGPLSYGRQTAHIPGTTLLWSAKLVVLI